MGREADKGGKQCCILTLEKEKGITIIHKQECVWHLHELKIKRKTKNLHGAIRVTLSNILHKSQFYPWFDSWMLFNMSGHKSLYLPKHKKNATIDIFINNTHILCSLPGTGCNVGVQKLSFRTLLYCIKMIWPWQLITIFSQQVESQLLAPEVKLSIHYGKQ